MESKENLTIESPSRSMPERDLARALLVANGHYGRKRSSRKAPLSAIIATRSGLDYIDLGQSSKALGRVADELSRLRAGNIAWVARERSSIAALAEALPQEALVHLGRWKPGMLSNREVGIWRREPIEAFVALGSGMEIAVKEARARGAYTVWLADTHCDPRLAEETVWLNASRSEALAVAVGALLSRAQGEVARHRLENERLNKSPAEICGPFNGASGMIR